MNSMRDASARAQAAKGIAPMLQRSGRKSMNLRYNIDMGHKTKNLSPARRRGELATRPGVDLSLLFIMAACIKTVLPDGRPWSVQAKFYRLGAPPAFSTGGDPFNGGSQPYI